MDAALVFGSLAGMGCLSFAVGAFVMAWLALFIPVTIWRQMRTHSRPVLWMLGLDWPEIKRTYKRAFQVYYARSLPESRPLSQPEASLPGAALDESGGVPPALSPLPNEPAEAE